MRNRYLDLLRAAAIVRVIVYHLFGWPWLSIVLPAMGVMFALAGSLAAASLDRKPAGQVITSRLRRLLPPLWLLGLVAVPVMLVAGWAGETDGDHPFSLPKLIFWILPVSDPQGSDLGIDAWEPLWYIRAYLWFILLSPMLYAFYRRAGWLAVASPILLLGVLDLTGFSLPDAADAALWDFVTYGACWIAGFAHHDGRLARLRPGAAGAVAVVLGAVALYWLRGHQGEDPWDLNDVSESQALWSVGFVLLALRWQPSMAWLARNRPLDAAVNLLNARAVTVYLWHNIAIAAVWPVLTVVALDDLGGDRGRAVELAAAGLLTLVAVVAFGWAEDLAAKRSPRLWPTAGPAPRTAEPPAGPTRPGSGGFAGATPSVRTPKNWPPAPRATADPLRLATDPAGTAGASEELPVTARVGRHAAEPGDDTRLDLGLPTTSLHAAELPTTSLPTTSLHAAELPTTSLPLTGLRAADLPTTSLPLTGLRAADLPSAGPGSLGRHSPGPHPGGVPAQGVPGPAVPSSELRLDWTGGAWPSGELPVAGTRSGSEPAAAADAPAAGEPPAAPDGRPADRPDWFHGQRRPEESE